MEEFEIKQKEFQEKVGDIANHLQVYARELQEIAKDNVIDYGDWQATFFMPDTLRHMARELEVFLKENGFDNYPF